MSTSLNSAGVSHAKSLINAGKVSEAPWDFTAEDGNKLLGPNGDDWTNHAKWFLATHPDQPEKTKGHYGYPFGKDGQVYWRALNAAKGRASQQGATAVAGACSTLMDMIKPPTKKDAEMKRAWATFEIKSFDEEQRTFEGIASTPTIDFGGDSMEPTGAVYNLPLPFMWQHGKGSIKDPVGWITAAAPNSKGIPVKGQFAKPKDDHPQQLKDDLNKAWVMVREKMVRGLSIGWSPIEMEPIKGTGFMKFLKWNWHELSAVTIGMNQEATIPAIKSIDDEQLRAALGTKQLFAAVSLKTPPGASGTSIKGNKVRTIKEQIEALEAKRAANVGRNEALLQKAAEEDRTLDGAEAEEYDTLNRELKTIDEHLVRLRAHEKSVIATAAPIEPDAGKDDPPAPGKPAGSQPYVSHGKSRLPPGIRFARHAMCVGAAKGSKVEAEEIALEKFKDTPEVANILRLARKGNLGDALLQQKTAVAAGTATDAIWASPLVQLQEMASEFVEFLRPMTLLGRIPGLRNVPFNIKFSRQTSGSSGTFVGEGLPKPLKKIDFDLLSLTWAKAATIIVMTDELMRFSNPSAEMLVRDDLAKGIADFLDKRFIDPVYAGVANVSPASITNGITPIASLGTSIANITDTAAAALDALIAGNFDPRNFVWLMNPSIANDLALKRMAQDILAFPGINALGGTFLGYPVITSNNVALSGSPTESFIVLLDPTQVMVADDGGVTIDMSNEASLQMDDAPSSSASSMISLWQSNMVGLRAERYINWRTRHTGAIQVITMNVKW